MTFKEIVEQAFGKNGDTLVLNFLREQELCDCDDDSACWKNLLEKCQSWRKEFLLWENATFVYGVHGWDLEIHIAKVCLPKKVNHWTEYLYHMALLVEYNVWLDNTQQIVTFDSATEDFYLESDYTVLSQEQWLDELENLYHKSLERYERDHKIGAEYKKRMEQNYPEFYSIKEYLKQNMKECEVVRMNNPNQDELIWYFGKDLDCLYVAHIADFM